MIAEAPRLAWAGLIGDELVDKMRMLAVAALALAWPMAALAGKPAADIEMEVGGKIAVGPDGLVRDYKLTSELPAAVAGLVERNVRSWKFEPILVDGKPVIAETRLRMVLHGTPVGEDRYTLKVENVWFGEPERAHDMKPPRYPTVAARAGLGAKVVLVLKLDADGNVVDVLAEQTSLDKRTRSEQVADKWRRVFEQASVAAAKKWKFTPGETVNGEAVGSLVRVPVTFWVGGSPKDDSGRWKAYVPGPVNPIPWVTEDSMASQAERDRLRDGDAQPLSSRFKLAEDVVGTTL